MRELSQQNKAVAALFDAQDRRAPEAIEFDLYKNSQAPMPTAETYAYWQGAFSFFNERLFQGKLANCVITLTRSRALGFFCPRAFQDGDGRTAHEISMNPTWFEARGDLGSLSTFVHEMAHQWREDMGPLNRKGGKGSGGYHDKVWAEKMEQVGLMPSHTGEPGGKRTGFQMTHYVIEGGRFDRACAELLGAGHAINWRDNRLNLEASPVTRGPAAAPAVAKNTRTRFICGACALKAWSRASAKLSCNDCNRPLIAR